MHACMRAMLSWGCCDAVPRLFRSSPAHSVGHWTNHPAQPLGVRGHVTHGIACSNPKPHLHPPFSNACGCTRHTLGAGSRHAQEKQSQTLHTLWVKPAPRSELSMRRRPRPFTSDRGPTRVRAHPPLRARRAPPHRPRPRRRRPAATAPRPRRRPPCPRPWPPPAPPARRGPLGNSALSALPLH